MNVGHSHPRVVAAAHAQIDRFAHTSISVFPWESYIRLAARLNEKAPGTTPKRTMFVNSGAEAVENAVKIARCATGRPGDHRFHERLPRPHQPDHGPDLQDRPLQEGLRPLPGRHLPHPLRLLLPLPAEPRVPGAAAWPARSCWSRASRTSTRPTRSPPSSSSRCRARAASSCRRRSITRKLKAICEDKGIVFIADEVQTGFGRTGTLFAMEHYGVEADIMTTAKSIGAGYPLGGHHRQGRDHGHARPGQHRRHVRRQPAGLRGGPGRLRHHGRGAPARTGRGDRPPGDGALDRDAGDASRRSATSAVSGP